MAMIECNVKIRSSGDLFSSGASIEDLNEGLDKSLFSWPNEMIQLFYMQQNLSKRLIFVLKQCSSYVLFKKACKSVQCAAYIFEK